MTPREVVRDAREVGAAFLQGVRDGWRLALGLEEIREVGHSCDDRAKDYPEGTGRCSCSTSTFAVEIAQSKNAMNVVTDESVALELAVKEASKSPCCKSKRGVVIWDADVDDPAPPVSGHNGPPPGFACDGSELCRAACGRTCLHAEHRALMEASPDHTDLLHVKVVDGAAVPSGPPSCEHCSKAILDAGIKRVWLLHQTGLRLYSAEDFHIQTLENCGLPVLRPRIASPEGEDDSTSETLGCSWDGRCLLCHTPVFIGGCPNPSCASNPCRGGVRTITVPCKDPT